MIKSVKLDNFLSFGSNQSEIELRPLNIIIGTNGCGKSNFLEAFDLLRNAAGDIKKPIREGGGVMEWLYKRTQKKEVPIASIEMLINVRDDTPRYHISFTSSASRFEITSEWLKNVNGEVVYENKQFKDVSALSLADKTIFEYCYGDDISYLVKEIKLYRDWTFGRDALCRKPQLADEPCEHLEADCSNLALVLNQMNHDIPSKKRLLKELQNFYPDVEDYFVNTIGNYVQIYFQERGLDKPIPASRLSDGTLRYLCLLAILCNPTLPPLICIEEPELGLHPDVIPGLAKLMTEVSEKCQLIITTHSDILVDSFTDNPEAILVAEKTEVGTQINRLQKEQLTPWLEKYRLGALWTSGDIGGTRW